MRYILIPILLFFASVDLSAQVTPNQETAAAQNQPSSYILKDIVVDGVKKYSPAQILRFTGLSKGEVVDIPGQKISSAVKKLWETESFSEVEVYVEDVEGQSVVLKFYLQDLMELGVVKFVGKGVGKSKNEKLIKDNNLKPGTKITAINNMSANALIKDQKKIDQLKALPSQSSISIDYINENNEPKKINLTK